MLPEKYPILFFGYGSLMYPKGLNCRGMKKMYTWGDLFLCVLSGYQRALDASYLGHIYYGLTTKSTSSVSGVLFQIESKQDFDRLLRSEYAFPVVEDKVALYYTLDITEDIPKELRKDMEVFTLLTKIPQKLGTISHEYLNHIWHGIFPWGHTFINNFLLTGGAKPDIAENEGTIEKSII